MLPTPSSILESGDGQRLQMRPSPVGSSVWSLPSVVEHRRSMVVFDRVRFLSQPEMILGLVLRVRNSFFS
jgi:hypothetical protein